MSSATCIYQFYPHCFSGSSCKHQPPQLHNIYCVSLIFHYLFLVDCVYYTTGMEVFISAASVLILLL